METVEVVIRIPCSELEYAKKGYTKAKADVVYRAIENGTVLPKGHGRLIDADEAIDAIINSNDWIGNKNENIKMIEGLPTIIEADKDGDINGKTNSDS